MASINSELQQPPKPIRRASVREGSDCANIGSAKKDAGLVAVRYFLDRPGYGLSQSSARLWLDPPSTCTAVHVQCFLTDQGIALDDLLVEIFIDKFQSYMLLEACIASCVEWDFSDVSYAEPGILNIRLTDLTHAQQQDLEQQQQREQLSPGQQQPQQQEIANTTPIGLFAFSIMAALETAELMGRLIPGSVDESFVFVWGPYMMMCGGLLQITAGIFQIFRNNIYGTTAFLGYGSFWFSTGLKVVLETFFSGDIPEDLLQSEDPWGGFIRQMFQLAFSAVLLKQTFVMNKLSSTLIFLVCIKIFAASLTGFSEGMKWLQLIAGWVMSVFAFYVFCTELTNQVYHREVFPVFRWSEKHSPEEVFGAAGRSRTLYSKAARLRQASHPTQQAVRAVRPCQENAFAKKEE